MQRNTKEFIEIKEMFEKAVNENHINVVSDFETDNSNKTVFYANGAVNTAFKAFLCGYSTARCVYI